MSSEDKKVLLFIKSPSHNLKPLEAFLSKRNFDVHSESDIKNALVKALELQPDFIFLAWDHPNPKISQLPALITQSIMAPVVAYIMSNTKEATRKLNICPVNYKLYPPISGPAIERLVLKSGKAAVAEQQRITQLRSKTKNQEELTQIRSDLLAHLDENSATPTLSESAAYESEHQQDLNNKMLRNKSIVERNDILQRSAKVNLSEEVINELKKSFNDKVKAPLESLLENLDDVSVMENDPMSNGEVIIQQGAENLQNLGTIVQKGLGEATTLGSTIQKNIINPEGIGNVIQKGTGMGEDFGSIVEKNLSNSHNLGSITEDGTTVEIPDHVEKDPRARAAYLEMALKEKENKQFKPSTNRQLRAYCMSVYSDNWCGYLVISTDANLDFSTIDLVFTEWIKLQFNNLQEIDEYDFFEFKFIDQGFIDELAPKADYFEQVTVRHYTLNVLFFPIDPTKMTLELNDEKNLIQVTTEEIPSDVELSFSLHLHLPENKKYLVYTQVNKALSLDQKKRLIANRVHILFTPVDFEKEYKKFIAEKNVKELYTNMKKKSSVV
ncbi:hypothetical protein K2P97_06690 [bacterium]|nr:hypothetical protein [bacterium]